MAMSEENSVLDDTYVEESNKVRSEYEGESLPDNDESDIDDHPKIFRSEASSFSGHDGLFLEPDSESWAAAGHNELVKSAEEIRLSKHECNFLAVVLKDAISQMLILGTCNRDLMDRRLSKDDGTLNNSMETPRTDDRLESIDFADLARDCHKIVKMNSDRNCITETFARIYLDLRNNRSFASLAAQLSDLAARTYQSIALELHHKEHSNKLKDLHLKLKKNTLDHLTTLFDCDLSIHMLKDEIDDSTQNSDIKVRFIDGWQRARIEQHTLAIDEAENVHVHSIASTKIKIEQERRIDSEIVEFIKQRTQDSWDQIEAWMEKYDNESEQIDIDIRVMKEKREAQLDETAALEALFAKHKKDIEDWTRFVTERTEKRELENLLLCSAIRLQAWWRGIMFRRRLAAKQAKERGKASKKKKSKKSSGKKKTK